MAYGFRSRRKSAASSYRRRTFGSGSYSKKFGSVKKRFGGRMKRFSPRFATVGFSKDVEKKYRDRAMTIDGFQTLTTGTDGSAGTAGKGGLMWGSQGWARYEYAGASSLGFAACSNDLLKYVDNGANVDQRIGNKVKGNYLKGAMTLTAARQQGASSGATNGDQNGESLATATDATSIEQFLRTTWRVVIFKDLQVNSTDPYIGWADVFQNQAVNTGSAAPIGEMGGVHSELNISNMGRFRILSDRTVELSAVCPQKTIKYLIGSRSIGTVRYNGSGFAALTDGGIYVVAAAFVNGTMLGMTGTTGKMVSPHLSLHSRFCFTDA